MGGNDDSNSNEEETNFLAHRFTNGYKNPIKGHLNKITCFEYGKPGHVNHMKKCAMKDKVIVLNNSNRYVEDDINFLAFFASNSFVDSLITTSYIQKMTIESDNDDDE